MNPIIPDTNDTWLLTEWDTEDCIFQAHPVTHWLVSDPTTDDYESPDALLDGSPPRWASDLLLGSSTAGRYVNGTDIESWRPAVVSLLQQSLRCFIRRARDAGARYRTEEMNELSDDGVTLTLARMMEGGGSWECPDEHSSILANDAEEALDRMDNVRDGGEIRLDDETVRRIDRDRSGRSGTAARGAIAGTGG